MKDTKAEVVLADTYALVEIIRGNENYKMYTEKVLVTTMLNLMEFYYQMLRESGEAAAEKVFNLYIKRMIPISITAIKQGMMFKLKYKKENLSYTDCVGYALAKELEIPFLTGDIKFEHKEYVRYVK